MARKQTSTLKQVAELSGYSQATVSMILNNRADVSFSAETVRIVNEAASRLGYERKTEASRLRRLGSGRLVALLCPNVSNPYYSSLVQSIEQSAWERDYQVMVMDTYRSPEAEARDLDMLRGSGVSGLIFAMPPRAPGALERLAEELPVVVVGDRDSSLGVDTVEMDNYGAGVLLARHLAELGHERVAFVSTTLDEGNRVRLRRFQGFAETFRASSPGAEVETRSRGVAPEEELGDLLLEHDVGYRLAREVMAGGRATAIVAVNDMVAYGAIDAMVEGGLSVPGDLSVCGFDNVFPSRLRPISLTTVDNYIVEKGHNAFAMLLGRIEGRRDSSDSPNVITRVEYPPRLVVRGSTSRPAGRGRE